MLTTSEQDAAYKRATGKHLPSMPNFLGKALLAINGATKNLYVSPSSSDCRTLIPYSLVTGSRTSNAYIECGWTTRQGTTRTSRMRARCTRTS